MKSSFVSLWPNSFSVEEQVVLRAVPEFSSPYTGVSVSQGRLKCCPAEGYFVHLAGAQEQKITFG